jgi:hypothetical protein
LLLRVARQYTNYINGTANTAAKQTAYSMLLALIDDEKRKERFVVPRFHAMPTLRGALEARAQLTWDMDNCTHRTREVEELGRRLAPASTTFALLPELTTANPLVTNYIQNRPVRIRAQDVASQSTQLQPAANTVRHVISHMRQAVSVVHGSPYPLEWYSTVPKSAQEIVDKITALKNSHLVKVSSSPHTLLARTTHHITCTVRVLLSPSVGADPRCR